MLRRFVIRARIDYECSTSIGKFTSVTTIFFLLNKICDGGSSKEPFLKAATLSILIWAYPRETKTNNGNYTNAAILPSEVAYRRRACALILPLCHKSVVSVTHEQNIICSKTQLDSIEYEQTIICMQFTGHVVCSRPMKRKKNMHRMIVRFIMRQRKGLVTLIFGICSSQFQSNGKKNKQLLFIQIIVSNAHHKSFGKVSPTQWPILPASSSVFC